MNVHTRVWTTVTCSYLLQLSFELHLPPSPHHHLWVGDASSEARVWCSLVQPLGNVLLVVALLSLGLFLTLLQFFLLTARQSTLKIRCWCCSIGCVAKTIPLHAHELNITQFPKKEQQIQMIN